MTEINKDNTNLVLRPPVVVIMGHIDHGKTTLLDFIRKSHVADKEAGAITQHIGAYEVEVNYHNEKREITFLDTPGHEAFSNMRSRGAKVADIAILIVAADEGVKPQTKEAINHILEAKIPYLVAINKIDKVESNLDKVKRELSELGVLVEGWGGNIPIAEISAKTGQGVDQMMDLILLIAEMEGLKGDKSKPAQGVVIESYIDSQRGYTATLLITDGVLHRGDDIAVGKVLGKAKMLENFKGESITEATFSAPVIVVGFEKSPKIGDPFIVGLEPPVMDLDKDDNCINRNFSDVFIIGEENTKCLPIIIKADVQGSLEALVCTLENLSKERQYSFKVLKAEVGDISEVDYKLAEPLKAVVLAFRIKIRPELKNIMINSPVTVLLGQTIYELMEALNKCIEKVEDKSEEEKILGKCKILVIFNNVKGNPVVGVEVIEGQIDRRSVLEIYREEQKIGEGSVMALEQNRTEANVVVAPNQFGLNIETKTQLQVGDIIFCYKRQS